ncbi:MAG: NAD-dependent deacylase [Anaerolineae bacterium]|nr:NAD-dependent deacylase [Anaerolineae bacterium]
MSDDSLIREAARVLRGSQRLVILTGAGVSKESGIPTFRDALEGLWENYDAQQLATPDAFRRNPRFVWDWYQHRREMMAEARPNPGHEAIAALQNHLPQAVVVTQNIDGLHQMAGSQDVIELHGSLRRNKCFDNCQGNPTLINIHTLAWNPATDDGPPPCPHCGGWVRPDVVWFHETLPPGALERAHLLCAAADVVLVIGTSGVVQPAANLPFVAARRNATIIEVNPELSQITAIARYYLPGPSGEIMPQVLAAMTDGE